MKHEMSVMVIYGFFSKNDTPWDVSQYPSDNTVGYIVSVHVCGLNDIVNDEHPSFCIWYLGYVILYHIIIAHVVDLIKYN
jgi:hypothetical protein